MALRTIRLLGDDILKKQCREVKEITPRIRTLIDDMLETMYDAEGVGLAAPQVGVLKQIAVVDVSQEGDEPIILINPEIVELEGEQSGQEGCLSVPNKVGIVKRAAYVKVRAYNEQMEEFTVEGEELLARALQHEIDHLSGIMYVTKTESGLMDVQAASEE